ncbi:putative interferon-induced GTP-binding protein Mx [Terfezia claveryi]|nr:putative interferon-induced GTP-binding protein Mx [Terfezia claveryi]KAF8458140.1 putative interferon-induced GTP-binding protein Mx [Terfezia claveryi]
MPAIPEVIENGGQKSWEVVSGSGVKTGLFDGKDKSKLFDIIDKFRENGIHEDISLPQLVVVGDQSSGKSSLLEALTRLPFPVAGTLCTRFATQIVFRRSAPGEPDRIKVTIIPSEHSGEDRKTSLRGFSRHFDTLEADDFSDVLSDAGDAMGLPKLGVIQATDTSGARFSDDVLKIELTGPKHDHFSVVDVPGLFQAATVYQTEEDGKMVESLVKRYINDSRTIILAVASSLHETANQKVFRLAKEADPRGTRTLGVLTKPDALQKGDESRIIDVARNNVTVLNHGWFVVRNRSTQDISEGVTLVERDVKERAFFSRPPWKSLAADRVGVTSLKKFLRALLEDHVRKEFPNLMKEMNALIEEAEKELEVLGPCRETPDEQRRILLKLATQYQNIAINGILGNYRDEFFDKVVEHRLRMLVAGYNDEFNDNIVSHGHSMNFEDVDSVEDIPDTKIGMYNPDSIYYHIHEVYRTSRGCELPGMVNPITVQNLFKRQSRAWGKFSEQHIDKIKAVTNRYIADLVKYVCPEQELESRLRARLDIIIEQAYSRADDELRSILKSEREGVLLTLDTSYANVLQEARKKRTMFSLKAIQLSTAAVYQDMGHQHLDEGHLREILDAVSPSNEVQNINDIHDILAAYYHVARKRFVDNVALQVVERHYLSRDEGGPAMCFSPQWVGGLSVDELEMVAGEDKAVSNRRAVLRDKLDKWRAAKKFAGGIY